MTVYELIQELTKFPHGAEVTAKFNVDGVVSVRSVLGVVYERTEGNSKAPRILLARDLSDATETSDTLVSELDAIYKESDLI